MITTLVLLSRLADGQWHHLIAEADRAARTLTFYVIGALEFMRVAHGTLADAGRDAGALESGAGQ